MTANASLINNNNIKMTPIRRQSTQVYPPQVAIKRSKNDILGILSKVFFGLLIVPYYLAIGLAWGIFGVVIFALNFGMVCANAALGGVINMILGNHILRIAHLSHYTSNIWACRIGAIGGPIAAIAFSVLNVIQCGPEMAGIIQILNLFISVALGAATGAIGCSILIKHHVELPGDIDVLHAARAGALGAAILGPGLLIATILIQSTVIGVLMLPLLLKIEYAFVRTRETITEGTTSVYSCLCVATRGGGDGDSIYDNEWA
ncbi:hypothetical protein BD410DRAFT_783325 [Rickenella mellea]|uniref:Uncharacterized protein n=1 Tax=Rickenella mellea TaxID=50990 RepID=A0A4Y7QHK5_9AGAM|nr:hypothetical protein BD410DRAFT_783325 [Rickenella mellea]